MVLRLSLIILFFVELSVQVYPVLVCKLASHMITMYKSLVVSMSIPVMLHSAS